MNREYMMTPDGDMMTPGWDMMVENAPSATRSLRINLE